MRIPERPAHCGQRQRQGNQPVGADADEHLLNAERDTCDQHQIGKLFDQIIDRVEHLPRRENNADSSGLDRDLRPLHHRNDRVERPRRRKTEQRPLKARIDLLASGSVKRGSPGEDDRSHHGRH
jgi:hypothetical protein